MKKFLAIIAIASFAVACNGSGDKTPSTDTASAPVVDTATVPAIIDTAVKAIDTTVKAAIDTAKAKM